jgi:hypothetical protein
MATSKAELARRLRAKLRPLLWERNGLTPSEKLVTLALLECMNEKGIVRVSKNELAKMCCMSLRNVVYIRLVLHEKGILCSAGVVDKYNNMVSDYLLRDATIAPSGDATIAPLVNTKGCNPCTPYSKVFTRERAPGLKPSILQTGGRVREPKTMPAFTKGEIEEKRAAAQKAINEAKDILLVAKKNLHRQAD